MEFRQLKHFLAVLETGNFARAAERSGVTQQALSASIGRLEAALDTRLFDRGRSGATPTPGALSLEPHVRLAFSELSRGQRSIVETADGHVGKVRFGVGQVFSGRIVPEAIARTNATHPGIRIEMIEDYAARLVEKVAAGEIDFFLGAPTRTLASNQVVIIENLFELTDRIVCRPEHPLTSRDSISVADLRAYPWIFPSQPSDEERMLNKACAAHGLPTAERVLYSDTIAAAVSLLMVEDYLIVGQPELFTPVFERELLTTLDVDIQLPSRSACLGYRRDAVLTPSTRLFIDVLLERTRAFLKRSGVQANDPAFLEWVRP